MKKFKQFVVTITVMVLVAASLAGCKKAEESGTAVGNGEVASSGYEDTRPADNEAVGNPETANANNAEMNYIDQKAEADAETSADGTSEGTEEAFAGYDPITYASAEEIPEGAYCIAHTDETGNTVYYLVYGCNGSYATVEKAQGAASVQPGRFAWTMDGYDDTVIPTMHEGDTLVYKSADSIPSYFSIERFSDEGYTIGIANLIQGTSGNYLYQLDASYLEPDSDTVGLATLGASQVYLVSVGNVRVSPSTVSENGTVKGLKRNENYLCDVRTGTESISAAFRANIHFYASLEQYNISNFYFSAKHTIEVGLESTTPTGYYCINNFGLFRYISAKDEGKELKAADYNIPFISLNVDGELVSTVDGFAIDENGFIVKER